MSFFVFDSKLLNVRTATIAGIWAMFVGVVGEVWSDESTIYTFGSSSIPLLSFFYFFSVSSQFVFYSYFH